MIRSNFIVVFEDEYGQRKYEKYNYGSHKYVEDISIATIYQECEYTRWQKEINYWNANREHGRYYLLSVDKVNK